MSRQAPLSCRALVALVDDYLAGDLEPGARARVEAHLQACVDCGRYLAQLRRTLGLLSEPGPTGTGPGSRQVARLRAALDG